MTKKQRESRENPTESSPNQSSNLSTDFGETTSVLSILLLESDQGIYQIWQEQMSAFTFQGKSVRWEWVETPKQAKVKLKKENHFCAIGLAIDTAKPKTSLDMIRWIKEELGNPALRVIVYGDCEDIALETSLFLDYGIHEYCRKSDLTSVKLTTLVIKALQSYQEVQNLEHNCQSLTTLSTQLKHLNETLEVQIEARTQELKAKTRQLEQEISDRTLAETAQRALEDKFSKAFQCTPHPITITSMKDGRHLEVNDAFLRTTGYTSEEVIGRTAIELKLWTKMEQRVNLFETLVNQGYIRDYEFEFCNRWGERRTALLSADIINLRGEECLLSVTNDITQRKQAEEALAKAKEAAEQANRAKSEFLANMSHELRTPLNAILGFTQVMSRDSSLKRDQRENLEIIARSGEHLLELINDILEMSKIEAGRVTLNPNNFDLYRLLRSIEEMLQLKAQSKGLQLLFECAEDVPQFICTDEGKLRQVLINLLGNAIKFTEDGGVVLRVWQPQRAAETEQVWIHFQVEDTGPGIAPEEIDHLFEPFTQTETGRKSQQGTGLGLPISRQFVQLMGGDFTVSSQVDQGSTFAFTIQVKLVAPSEVELSLPTRKVKGLAPGQSPKRILAVDDRLESRMLLVQLLGNLGFEVEVACNGEEAIALWKRWYPHLILMDMQMPVMDGYEATRQIKSTAKGRSTIIFALTASAFEEERNLVLTAGCDEFLRKPFRETVLLEKIAQHLAIEYVYEDTETELSSASKPELPLEDYLKQMESHWIEELYQTAVKGFDDEMVNLIEAIPDHLAPLSQVLSEWAHNFRFDCVVALIEKVKS